jgi:hypothetical protein
MKMNKHYEEFEEGEPLENLGELIITSTAIFSIGSYLLDDDGFHLEDANGGVITPRDAGIRSGTGAWLHMIMDAMHVLKEFDTPRSRQELKALKASTKPQKVEFAVGDVVEFNPYGEKRRLPLMVRVREITEANVSDGEYRVFYRCSSPDGKTITNTASAGCFPASKYYNY